MRLTCTNVTWYTFIKAQNWCNVCTFYDTSHFGYQQHSGAQGEFRSTLNTACTGSRLRNISPYKFHSSSYSAASVIIPAREQFIMAPKGSILQFAETAS